MARKKGRRPATIPLDPKEAGMPTAWLQKTLTNLYEEALDSLDVAISACPDEL